MNYDTLTNYCNVSRETYEKIAAYVSLLTKWQPALNLVASSTLPHLWERHLIDSLQLQKQLPEKRVSCHDIGSGGGFPAIPLAISSPHHPFTLIESDERKAIFLQEVARQLSLKNVTIANIRAEEAALPCAGIITARACAPLATLLQWSSPLLSPTGKCLFLKGTQYRKELKEALEIWSFDYDITPSQTDPEAAIIRVSEIQKR